jgi:hypothetical protein
LLGLGVRLDRAVMEDVADGQSALGEASRHQQTAMTVERLALGAQDADLRSRHGVEQAAEAGSVFRPRGHRFIVGDAIAIEAVVARPAAQRVARRGIADIRSRQRGRELLLREPRIESRMGHAAHIGNEGHPCIP